MWLASSESLWNEWTGQASCRCGPEVALPCPVLMHDAAHSPDSDPTLTRPWPSQPACGVAEWVTWTTDRLFGDSYSHLLSPCNHLNPNLLVSSTVSWLGQDGCHTPNLTAAGCCLQDWAGQGWQGQGTILLPRPSTQSVLTKPRRLCWSTQVPRSALRHSGRRYSISTAANPRPQSSLVEGAPEGAGILAAAVTAAEMAATTAAGAAARVEAGTC